MDVVDLPDPVPGIAALYEVSAAGINYADTHHQLSCKVDQRIEVTASARE